ncbi:hypothetical protein D9M71_595260 [compost metagenome]
MDREGEPPVTDRLAWLPGRAVVVAAGVEPFRIQFFGAVVLHRDQAYLQTLIGKPVEWESAFVPVVRPGGVGPEAALVVNDLKRLDELLFCGHDFVLGRPIAAKVVQGNGSGIRKIASCRG